MARPSVPSVAHLLLAEFDIEEGSKVSFQYPEPTGTETNQPSSILAELMLPDGAHNRDQDWTIFFLNQTVPTAPQPLTPTVASPPPLAPFESFVYKYTSENQEWQLQGEAAKTITCFSSEIVITDPDGAVYRTIPRALKPRHERMGELQICIVVGDDALSIRVADEAQEAQVDAFLQAFTAVAADDGATAVDAANARRQSLSLEATPSTAATSGGRPFLYVLNLVRTKHIANVKRGARTKAMAICTQHQFLHVYKPLLLIALDRFFDTPTESILQELYQAVNQMDLSGLPVLTQQEKRIIRASDQEKRLFSTKVRFKEIDFPMKIPVAMFSEEVGDFSLIKLVNRFSGHTTAKGENGVMAILNALLRQQRIIFLGYNLPSGEVANYVLAAVSMLNPPLRGFTLRAFPYTNLSNIDTVLQFPGFIAGVTNPRYEDMERWWDVLCNVATGTIKFASHLPPQTTTEPHVAIDTEFIADVMAAIQAHQSEDRVRAKFQDYVQNIVDIAFDDAEFPDDATRRKLIAANSRRAETWHYLTPDRLQVTDSWLNYANDRKRFRETRAIQDVDVYRLIARLRIRTNIPDREVLAIYHDFERSINTEEQLLEFLSYLPENQGGLFPVGVALFHPSDQVRQSTAALFDRIAKFKAGSGFITNMNHFLRLAYDAVRHA